MTGGNEGYGPQPPSEHDLHRARGRVLETGQGGGTPAEVAQAGINARQKAARDAARDPSFRFGPGGYAERYGVTRAEVEASYSSGRYPDLEAGQ